VKGTLGLIGVVLLLSIPTQGLSDIGLAPATNGHTEQPPRSNLPEAEMDIVAVEIRSRMFIPERVFLHREKKTVIRFRNHDTELHSVVAKDLFAGIDIDVGGNGAQEYGPNGLKRVIIPAEGMIEFQFTPTRTGTFLYLCDMPGHEMRAVIVVE